MVNDLSNLLPAGLTASAAAYAGGLGACLGVVLWLAGSRFGHGLVTLVSVAAGATLGKMVPGWFGWHIDPMGTAFGGALVLGILGYVYHRMWEGVGLGLLMAGWAAVATWLLLKSPDQSWMLPIPTTWDLATYAKSLWDSMPSNLAPVMPYAIGCSLGSGLLTAALWPRVGSRAFYSMLGVTVVVVAAELLGRTGMIPSTARAQVAVAILFAMLGILIQWRFTAPAKRLNGDSENGVPANPAAAA
jgi:hypothetical protein